MAESLFADDQYAARLAQFDDGLIQESLTGDGQSLSEVTRADYIDPADAEVIHLLRRCWPYNLRESHPSTSIEPAESETRSPPNAPRLGRFRILAELGRGGFAIVLRAYDPEANREVAIKVPRPEILSNNEARQRFLQEAEATSRLHHPNVVGILEVGQLGDTVFLVTECAPSGSLADWLRSRNGPLEPHMASALVEQLARGTEYVHECGLLHRDIKPSNVLLWPANEAGGAETFCPRLTDFGLAKYVELSLMATGTSVLLGTPLYMAPEQAACDHESAGPWTDVYSLGVILYELLAGRPPFLGPGILTLLDDLRHRDPPALREMNPAVPRGLAAICRKCLEKNPVDRYASAGELASDLSNFLNGRPILARHPGPVQRLWRWVRKRQRIREAGTFMIMLNVAVLIWWSWIIPYFVIAGSEGIDRWAIARDGIIVAALFEIPQIVIGAFTILERRWAIWCGLGWSTVNVLFSIVGQSGTLVPFGNLYQQMPAMRVAMFGLMTALFLIEFLYYLAAMMAEMSSRKCLR